MSPPTSTTGGGSGGGAPFAGLTLKNLTSSLIICGPVSGAAHLTNITSCTIVVASRQFRMHDSRDCHVYLSTASRPIIEACSGICFAPLPERYLQQAEQGDQWRNVDDFKWLRSEPSPNWDVLGVSRRVRPEVWREVVPGGPGLGPEEILKAINLPK